MSTNQSEVEVDNLNALENDEFIEDDKSKKKFKAAPVWIISLLLHGIVIAGLAYIIVEKSKKAEDIIVTTQVIAEVEEPIEEVKEVAVIKEKTEVVVDSQVDLPVQVTNEVVTDHNETNNNIESVTATAEGTSEGISDSPQVGSGLMGNIGGGGGGGGTFGQRTGGGKKRAIMKGGGSKKTESAVELGLMWLANHQEEDGRWNCGKYEGEVNEQFDVATTGAALLAFLGAGYNDKIGKYKVNVKKGLEYMMSKQKENGAFFHVLANNYTNGMCTMALAEAIGLGCGVPAWKKNLEKAVDNILKQQIPYAGWTYFDGSSKTKEVTDMSLTGWCMMGLKSAKMVGVRENEISIAFHQVGDLLDTSCFTKDNTSTSKGIAWYNPVEKMVSGNGAAMQPIAMLVRQYLGWNRTENWLAAAAKGQTSVLPKDVSTTSIYRIYYSYLALFQQGGDDWKTWNDAVTPVVLKAQRLDGDFKGSWDNNQWEMMKVGGRPLSTAFLVLSLEIYYRYASVMKN
jgi:hypothetical protein